MLWPMTPSSVTTSVNTSGDSATTPLAVRCGWAIGTRTARTRNSRTVGQEPAGIPASPDLAAE